MCYCCKHPFPFLVSYPFHVCSNETNLQNTQCELSYLQFHLHHILFCAKQKVIELPDLSDKIKIVWTQLWYLIVIWWNFVSKNLEPSTVLLIKIFYSIKVLLHNATYCKLNMICLLSYLFLLSWKEIPRYNEDIITQN